MKLSALGDQAVLAYLPDEAAAVRFAAAVRAAAPPWLQDVVPAYASVGVFFDPDRVGLGEVLAWLRSGPSPSASEVGTPPRWRSGSDEHAPRSGRHFTIPVCYELQSDMARVCDHTGLTASQRRSRHRCSTAPSATGP